MNFQLSETFSSGKHETGGSVIDERRTDGETTALILHYYIGIIINIFVLSLIVHDHKIIRYNAMS